jgi:phospholipid N-methyltransferase
MGTSHPESRPWVISQIRSLKPKTILDVGAGSGTYQYEIFKSGYTRAKMDAIEVWEPYIEEYELEKKYSNVFNVDVREWNNFDYDLVIFGDILEHMSKEDALKVWENTSLQARCAIISIPIIHYHQGAINNNPYEEHVKDDWTSEEVLDSFSHIQKYWVGDVVGSYLAIFPRDGII